MSTAMKQHKPRVMPVSARQEHDDKQLRRDRWTLFIVVALIVGLMTLVIWLASLGGGVVEYDGIDYWEMMP